MEQTLSLIKPDAVERNLIGKIISVFEENNLIIREMKKIKILKKDTPKSLAKKVLKQEHKLYPKAILKIFN